MKLQQDQKHTPNIFLIIKYGIFKGTQYISHKSIKFSQLNNII